MEIEKELLIKSMYESGATLKEIKEQCHVGDRTISNIREKYGIKGRGSKKENQIDELVLCEAYKSGMLSSDICKKFKCSTNTISKILDKYSIKKRTTKKVKDFKKFYDLTLPETQYWIGYICADGSIQYNTSSRVYAVRLYSKDIETIDRFVRYFGEDVVSVNTTNPSGVIMAYISSKELCQYFINVLNIPPNKSNILNPNVEFTKNFILGYFDGDGCIRNTSSNGQTRYECNITSGCKPFLEKIKNILDSVGIYSILYQHTDCKAYKIRIDRKEESEKFYRWLYSDMVTCMSRKLNNFVALYGNIKEKESGEIMESPKTDNHESSVPLTKYEDATTNS